MGSAPPPVRAGFGGVPALCWSPAGCCSKLQLALYTRVCSLPPLTGHFCRISAGILFGVGHMVRVGSEIKFKVKSHFLISNGVGPPPSPGRFWRGSSHLLVTGRMLEKTSARALHEGVLATPPSRAFFPFQPRFTFWRGPLWAMLHYIRNLI